MTDEELRRFLKPRTHWGSVLATALAVGTAVWAATAWLHSRASADETKDLQRSISSVVLDQAVMKGHIEAINVRIEEGFKAVNAKLDSNNEKRRR